ncbi:hypothetical protein OnM2_053024 [Erysiphe neolycopersici]|uniref:Uncharacterized protein n=1 Tax=Erysiphe neolycopersici TaxID=212602 RepID=A0A420HS31_9PEZI|nr:hypothetical protein OnM2_053024 [Erysiphe neolycopersici]
MVSHLVTTASCLKTQRSNNAPFYCNHSGSLAEGPKFSNLYPNRVFEPSKTLERNKHILGNRSEKKADCSANVYAAEADKFGSDEESPCESGVEEQDPNDDIFLRV